MPAQHDQLPIAVGSLMKKLIRSCSVAMAVVLAAH